MTIKYLKIDNYTKIKHLTTIGNLYDLEILNIGDLVITISKLYLINLPINLKHLFIDLNLKNEQEKEPLELKFSSYKEAVDYIINLSDRFKIPFGCKLTFRIYCEILDEKNGIDYCGEEFICSENKIVYDTYIDSQYREKISKSFREFSKLCDNELENYEHDEIFAVDSNYVSRFVKLIKILK